MCAWEEFLEGVVERGEFSRRGRAMMEKRWPEFSRLRVLIGDSVFFFLDATVSFDVMDVMSWYGPGRYYA